MKVSLKPLRSRENHPKLTTSPPLVIVTLMRNSLAYAQHVLYECLATLEQKPFSSVSKAPTSLIVIVSPKPIFQPFTNMCRANLLPIEAIAKTIARPQVTEIEHIVQEIIEEEPKREVKIDVETKKTLKAIKDNMDIDSQVKKISSHDLKGCFWRDLVIDYNPYDALVLLFSKCWTEMTEMPNEKLKGESFIFFAHNADVDRAYVWQCQEPSFPPRNIGLSKQGHTYLLVFLLNSCCVLVA
ncbi:hypothetical protein JHK87_050745 [Glycine soja]|nr:hypothetical protein JHK87_050745 [Glycine soja]